MPAQSRPNGARRPYHRSGAYTIARALPDLVERVADATISDDVLTPVERAVRSWRNEIIADLGGPDAVSAARRALVDTVTGSMIMLHSVDRYLFELAAHDGLVNRRSRRLHAIVEQRQRIADSLARQLQALGLDRMPPKVPDLADYLAARDGSTERA